MSISLDDIGTRYEHYTQLLDLWEEGIDILERHQELYPGTFDAKDKERLEELKICVAMLQRQVDRLSHFNPLSVLEKIEKAHRDVIDNYRKE